MITNILQKCATNEYQFCNYHFIDKCKTLSCKLCEVNYNGRIDDEIVSDRRKIQTKVQFNREVINHIINKKYFCIKMHGSQKSKKIDYVCINHPNKIITINYMYLHTDRFKECVFCNKGYTGNYEVAPILKNSKQYYTNSSFITFLNNKNNIIVNEIIEKTKGGHFQLKCKCIIHNEEFISNQSHIGSIKSCRKCNEQIIYTKKHIENIDCTNLDIFVYLKKIVIGDMFYIKVGLTKKEDGRIFRGIDNRKVDLLESYKVNIKDGIDIEESVLNKFNNYKAVFDEKFDGHTEYFNYSNDLLIKIKKEIEERL